jgi:hypothetical protein
LGASKKRRSLHDIIIDHKIDIIAVQETKKQKFSNRLVKSISTIVDVWIELPAIGLSGGILLGLESSKFSIEQQQIGQFSISVLLRNRIDSVLWCFTVVYGPVNNDLKTQFWEELSQIGNNCPYPWLICGDFNSLIFRYEK